MISMSITDSDGLSIATALGSLRTLLTCAQSTELAQLTVYHHDYTRYIVITVKRAKDGTLTERYEQYDTRYTVREAKQ